MTLDQLGHVHGGDRGQGVDGHGIGRGTSVGVAHCDGDVLHGPGIADVEGVRGEEVRPVDAVGVGRGAVAAGGSDHGPGHGVVRVAGEIGRRGGHRHGQGFVYVNDREVAARPSRVHRDGVGPGHKAREQAVVLHRRRVGPVVEGIGIGRVVVGGVQYHLYGVRRRRRCRTRPPW